MCPCPKDGPAPGRELLPSLALLMFLPGVPLLVLVLNSLFIWAAWTGASWASLFCTLYAAFFINTHRTWLEPAGSFWRHCLVSALVRRCAWLRGVARYFRHTTTYDEGACDILRELLAPTDGDGRGDSASTKSKKSAAAKPGRAIFMSHPHGVFGIGVFCTFIFERPGSLAELVREASGAQIPHVPVGTISGSFYVPVWREILMSMGFVPVSGTALRCCLDRDRCVALVPGGASEAALAAPLAPELVLKRRLGIFRIALEQDAAVVPVFHFGELEAYRQARCRQGGWGQMFQVAFKRVAGWVPCFVVPNPLPGSSLPGGARIATVVGKPVRPREGDRAEDLQARYIKELLSMYSRHRSAHGYKNLKIV